MTSIRRMLVVSLLGMLGVLMLLAGAVSYHAGLQEAGEMFDARLAQSSRVLLSLVDEPLGDLAAHPGETIVIRGWHGAAQGVGEALAFPDGHAYETKLALQVLDAEGRLMLRSDSAPTRALAPLVAGYADVPLEDGTWRVFSLRSASGRWYQSGERADIRAELAADIALGTLVPLLVALPLMALALWWLVTWVTRGLTRVSDAIGERDPDRLDPLAIASVPREVHGMVHAVNGLLERVSEGLERERRFVADAAHELRTPVAALKVHADNLRAAGDATERAESQVALDAGVERVERMVAQLLALSRVERTNRAPAYRSLRLDALVQEEVDAIEALAMARNLRLQSALAPVVCIGDEHGLQVLVRNLLENALRFTPEGGTLAVSLADEGAAGSCLVVEDSGPGIAPDARERVFGRFARELGTGVQGSGLGLSIVREVAWQHAATIALDDSPLLGGLRAIVRFKPAATRGQ